MNIYILTVYHIKLDSRLIVKCDGRNEMEAKEYARKFLNGNCKFESVKLLGKRHDCT